MLEVYKPMMDERTMRARQEFYSRVVVRQRCDCWTNSALGVCLAPGRFFVHYTLLVDVREGRTLVMGRLADTGARLNYTYRMAMVEQDGSQWKQMFKI